MFEFIVGIEESKQNLCIYNENKTDNFHQIEFKTNIKFEI